MASFHFLVADFLGFFLSVSLNIAVLLALNCYINI